MQKGTDGRPVVVLAEEDGRQLEDIGRYLTGEGFAVLAAADSETALAHLEKRSDVRGLVTDAHVPGAIDGFELAQAVRERWPAVAVVLMSGHSDPSSGPVPEGGAFVAKPYLFEHLASTVRRLMAKSD